MYKKIIYLSILFIFLTGCSLGKPVDNIHKIIESTVEIENNFLLKRDTLKELEASEQALYTTITDLTGDDINVIRQLSEEAYEIAVKREEQIKHERENMLLAKAEFEKLTPLINEIKKEELKELTEEVKRLMEERYTAFEDIFTWYSEGIQHDKELYVLLQQDDLTLEILQEQVQKSNQSYMKVKEANDRFNSKTQQFNDIKKAFYIEVGFKVKE